MSEGKKLRRSKDNRMIAGVAAGVADYLGLDPTVVRLVWALMVIFAGFGVLLYLIMWIIMPEQQPEATASPAGDEELPPASAAGEEE